jgi:hypothetical protein
VIVSGHCSTIITEVNACNRLPEVQLDGDFAGGQRNRVLL